MSSFPTAASISPADAMLESLRLDDSMVCADGRDHHNKRKHVSNQQAMFQQLAQYQPVPKRQRCRQTRTADSCHVHVKTLCGKTVKIDIPSLKQTRVSELKQMLEQVRSSARRVSEVGSLCVAAHSPSLVHHHAENGDSSKSNTAGV